MSEDEEFIFISFRILEKVNLVGCAVWYNICLANLTYYLCLDCATSSTIGVYYRGYRGLLSGSTLKRMLYNNIEEKYDYDNDNMDDATKKSLEELEDELDKLKKESAILRKKEQERKAAVKQAMKSVSLKLKFYLSFIKLI